MTFAKGSLRAKPGPAYGEIEVHWHRRHDDAESFEKDLLLGLEDYRRAGALAHPGLARKRP